MGKWFWQEKYYKELFLVVADHQIGGIYETNNYCLSGDRLLQPPSIAVAFMQRETKTTPPTASHKSRDKRTPGIPSQSHS